MKYTISVSKTYKHRGSFRHKLSTKKHWFHYFYENDEIDEELKLKEKILVIIEPELGKTKRKNQEQKGLMNFG